MSKFNACAICVIWGRRWWSFVPGSVDCLIVFDNLHLGDAIIQLFVHLLDFVGLRPCFFLLPSTSISLIMLSLMRVHFRFIATTKWFINQVSATHVLCLLNILDRIWFFLALSGRSRALIRSDIESFNLFELIRRCLYAAIIKRLRGALTRLRRCLSPLKRSGCRCIGFNETIGPIYAI